MFEHSNWSILTVNFLVVLYLALGGITLCALTHLIGAKWQHDIRQLVAALYALFPLAFVLLIILLVGGKYTFPWLNASVSAEQGYYLNGWHNYTFLVARQVLGLLAVMVICWIFVKRQAVSERSDEDKARFHTIACWIPYVLVLYGTMVAWDFEMTMLPSWHSALYGMQHVVSNFGMMLSFLVIWIYVLNTRDKLVRPVGNYVYNYLAQIMFGFTILFTYTFFSQYLIIWYPNLGFEVDRIMGMQNGDYSVLWWSIVALKFIIPFTILAFPVPRRTPAAILAVAVCIIVGTLFERYIWIAGIHDGKGDLPVLAFIGISAVVAAIGFTLVRRSLRHDHLIKV